MGCKASKNASSRHLPGENTPANAVLEYYPIELLGRTDSERSKRVFGPYIKLQSYDPAAKQMTLSFLAISFSSHATSSNSNRPSSSGRTEPRQSGSGAAGAAAAAADARARTCEASEGVVPALTWARDGKSGGPPTAGEVIDCWKGWNFWRFRLPLTLGDQPSKLSYSITPYFDGQHWSVQLPSATEQWHWAYYSCNGLHNPKDYEETGGIQPLWRDLLQRHKQQPFHLMVGGGDQLYNDAAFNGPIIKGWDVPGNPEKMRHRIHEPFTPELQAEMEQFYFGHYAFHFAQPLYCDALATIPSLNVWDDHDIFDGWGSYPPELQNCAVFHGVYAASRRFYLLFQMHTTDARLGADGYWPTPGPEHNVIVQLGDSVALAMLDTRSKRDLTQVMSLEARAELGKRLFDLPESVRHLVMVVAVPLLYPALPVQDLLQSVQDDANGRSAMSVVLQKTGLASLMVQRFGLVLILDDMIDNYNSEQHVKERDELLALGMAFAKARSARVSFISGNVHCAGYGMFRSRPQHAHRSRSAAHVPPQAELAADPCYMPQIISSAIANVPPPAPIMSSLCLVGDKVEDIVLGLETRMVPLFGHADESSSLLCGRRNWCEVRCAPDASELCFDLRCEHEFRSTKVDVYTVAVPDIRQHSGQPAAHAQPQPEEPGPAAGAGQPQAGADA